MKIIVVDCKQTELINIKIELSEYMFIVAPEIVDQRFNYIKPKLMEIRNRYMKLYLENTKLFKVYEYNIYNEMKEMLIEEMKDVYRNEGIMYYTL